MSIFCPSYKHLVGCFLLFRVAQRVYYLSKSHSNISSKAWNDLSAFGRLRFIATNYFDSYWFQPRKRLEKFLFDKDIPVTNHVIRSSIDGTKLRYRRLGTGKKHVLLANGVGTDLYMWLSVLQYLFDCKPGFFSEYTLVVQTYRGLFGAEDDGTPSAGKRHQEVEVTIDNCVEDVQDIMHHAGVKKYECMIGWSTGAQVALACTAKHPLTCTSLFLMNPSAGHTLHTFGQIIHPLPVWVQNVTSKYLKRAFLALVPMCDTSVWDTWRKICENAYIYPTLFGVLALLCGFPPEMATYFDEYNREIFTCRTHTASLIKLIVALDEPAPFEDVCSAVKSVEKVVILGGVYDFMCGVFLGEDLSMAINASGSRTSVVNTGVVDSTAGSISSGTDTGNCGNGASKMNTRSMTLNAMHVTANTTTTNTTTAATTSVKCDYEVFSMGSHFLLLEWPEVVAQQLARLLTYGESSAGGSGDSASGGSKGD